MIWLDLGDILSHKSGGSAASATAKCINFCELRDMKSEVLFESALFPFGQTTGILMLSRHSWQLRTRFIMLKNCEHM